MWANVLLRHWLLTTIAGVCLILNIGLVLEIVSAINLGKPFDQIERTLFLEFVIVGPSIMALSVVEGCYVFLGKGSVDRTEAYWMRIFLVLSIVNSAVPIIFGAFAFGVHSLGYFWLR